jgi:energy-coupling factor transporter ATP-binding protein EcfA2
MISELKIRNFKSLESVDLKLGHFNLLVGANASGKSNFLDALRFLQGVGYGFSINEILNGRPPLFTSVKWDGIRGGSNFAAFRKPDGSQPETDEFHVTFREIRTPNLSVDELTYNLTCSVENGVISIAGESLYSGATPVIRDEDRPLMEPLPVEDLPELPGPETPMDLELLEAPLDPMPGIFASLALTPRISFWGHGQFQAAKSGRCANYISSALADMQFLDPLPAALRGYSSKVARLGENGEGFAALIHEIESNGSKPTLLEWLKELRPDEVDDIHALEGLNNDFMVAIKEGNKEFRAPSISDGTLRFIALAAAFFQPSMPKVLVIEEIEKGLHPSRLRLLLELMRSQSKRTGTQVFATTHSPTLLAWLTEEDRKTTFVCTRDAESGATKMRSLAEIPRFEELIEEGSHIDELFAEGWLESAPQ